MEFTAFIKHGVTTFSRFLLVVVAIFNGVSTDQYRKTTMTPSPELTTVQKRDLSRLWTTQTNGPQGFDSSSKQAPTPRTSKSAQHNAIDPHTLNIVARLHAFFVAILQQARYHRTKTRPANCLQSNIQYLKKDVNLTCMEPYGRLVVLSGGEIRLVSGHQQVLSIPHESFVDELNHFELRGRTPVDDDMRNSFGAYLHFKPELSIYGVGTAMALAISTMWRTTTPIQQPQHQSQSQQYSKLDQFLDTCHLKGRFLHVQPKVAMTDIKTGLVRKLITVKGHVVKARPKRLRVVTADFSCQKCGVEGITHAFEGGRYSVPTKCTTSNCRSKAFNLVRNTARYINAQELRLQEAQEESIEHAGRTPRQIEVELLDDLVDSCRPGDVVSVSGIVDAINTAVSAGKTGRQAQETSTYKLYLKAHSVATLSESNNRRRESQEGRGISSNKQGGSTSVTFTEDQKKNITNLMHADHFYFGFAERRAFPFDLLVRSICPSIIGHDMVKAGILLGLLGGTPPATQGGADKGNTIRSNSHILIVGDPGMGKSQMLLAASQIAARSVYVGGNTASTTGLTVSLTKEAGGEVGIEAGALVLADQGVCCIDEFDKMGKSHQDGLLEAMEQQQISIAKAGVVASLPARCSVLAAANPKHGSYNMGKTVAENLNMATPILSRFDLVFILRDKADGNQDRLVSSNIMNLYRHKTKNQQNHNISSQQNEATSREYVSDSKTENRMLMRDRLPWVAAFQKDPLPADLVRDYISYAREYCKPKLTKEAAVVLRDYFMTLRYPEDGTRPQDTVPITTRQLEALIRLSQARAKACLREFVLEEDALDVVELMAQSVEQVHADENGVLDRSRGGAGGTSKRKMKKAFANELKKFGRNGAECTMDDLRRIADKVNCDLGDFNSVVDEIRDQGTLMKKSNGNYQVVF